MIHGVLDDGAGDADEPTYPKLITLDQASAIAHRPIGAIYDWSRRGMFDGFKTTGRQILLDRDAFVRFLILHRDL